MAANFYGIDIGCTSIKHGRVSFEPEARVQDFDSIYLPEASGSDEFTQSLEGILQNPLSFQAVGMGFPSTVRNNEVLNLSIRFNDIWQNVRQLLSNKDIACFAINDADAAGIAEVYRHEAQALRKGVTLVITLGTGIGSAVFMDGNLLPNTEVGLIELHGMTAEKYAAASVKTRQSLSLQAWASRLQEFLAKVEVVLKPDTLILGGGISADFEQFSGFLNTRAHLIPAYFRNQAGVIGAARYACLQMDHQTLPE